MSDRTNDLLSCPICMEDFQEDGEFIPRILPCSHTLCEGCVVKLLGRGGGISLICPECTAQHAAPKKERTFPQNKYLLMVIKRRDSTQRSESGENSDEVRRIFCQYFIESGGHCSLRVLGIRTFRSLRQWGRDTKYLGESPHFGTN